MYNVKKYGFVEVYMDKNDTALEELISDLPYQLYESKPTDTQVCFKGLLRKRDIKDLNMLKSASPYGNGYDIRVEGVKLEELGLFGNNMNYYLK